MKAFVLGLGVSGEYAARLLLREGFDVLLLDQGKPERQAERVSRLEKAGVKLSFCGDTLPDGPVDLCVASPAFALEHPWIQSCAQKKIPVISELELGARYWKGKTLAITGSKGKSSLVKLCSDTLNRAGHSASPAGNYGIPLCQLVLEQPNLEWAVVEVSSFQMEHTEEYSPDVAILLNMQADHLNRHGTMEVYRALKLKLFRKMKAGTLALLPEGMSDEGNVPSGVTLAHFGTKNESEWRYDQTNGSVQETKPAHKKYNLRTSWFDNPILGIAAAAGCAALQKAGLSITEIEDGFLNFEPLPHRMQLIATRPDGVYFVDDSKATSLTAMAAALFMVKKPVRLIAGGILKENDLESVKELLTKTTKKVYLIGQCSEEMFRAWSPALPCEQCETMDRAVERAAHEAQKGETVLLSPGTASFDQFTGYQERGERFVESVRKVAGVGGSGGFLEDWTKNKE